MAARNPAHRFTEPVEVTDAVSPFTKGCDLAKLMGKVDMESGRGDVIDEAVGTTLPFHPGDGIDTRVSPLPAPRLVVRSSRKRCRQWTIVASWLTLMFALAVFVGLIRSKRPAGEVVPYEYGSRREPVLRFDFDGNAQNSGSLGHGTTVKALATASSATMQRVAARLTPRARLGLLSCLRRGWASRPQSPRGSS